MNPEAVTAGGNRPLDRRRATRRLHAIWRCWRLSLMVVLSTTLLYGTAGEAAAQIMNTPFGTQYGKNKVTYEAFDFWVYRAPHFDVYYYPEEEAHLDDVVAYAEHAYELLSRRFNHELSKRTPIIFYQTHAEFEQTHITPFFLPEGVAAFAEPAKGRLVLPVDDPPDELRKLITHEVTHIFEFDFFFGSRVGGAFRAQPPGWLMEGLAEHMAENLTSLDEMLLRDTVLTDTVPTLIQMAANRGFFVDYVLGQVVWDYIYEQHGIEGMRLFLSEVRRDLGQNVEHDLERAFNISPQEFNNQFREYLRERYLPNQLRHQEADEFARNVLESIPARERPFVFTPMLSPDGSQFAAISFDVRTLNLDIYRFDMATGARQKNLTAGLHGDYEYIIGQGVTVGFRAGNDLSWSPDGDTIAFFARTGPSRTLFLVDAQSGRVLHKKRFELDQTLSPSIGPDGKIVFGGHLNGVRDVWIYDPSDDSLANLTQDELYDYAPIWSPDGRSIVFASHVLGAKKLFRIDLARPQQRVQLSFGLSNETQASFARDGSKLYFTSDRTGTFNLYSMELATGTVNRLTNILFGAFFPQPLPGPSPRLLFSSFGDQEYNLYTMDLAESVDSYETYVAEDEALPDETVEGIERALAEASTVELNEENVSRTAGGGWHIEAVQLGGGVTSRGTILSNTAIVASDLLGNHRITGILGSIESQRHYGVNYTNIRKRFNWGVSAASQRAFFFTIDPINNTLDREAFYELDGGELFGEYPLSRDYRLELSLGFYRRKFALGGALQTTTGAAGDNFGNRFNNGSFMPIGLALVGDRARFKEYGPFSGHRFRLEVRSSPAVGSLTFTDLQVDWRRYLQVTQDSLFALRLWGARSMGDDPNVFFFGGLNQLRGFNFLQFSGSRAAFANLEYRFPIMYEARGGAMALRHIRGTLFLDVGTAWFGDQEYKFWEDGGLRDARASFGLGLGFNLGPLPFTWYLSQRTNFKEFFGRPAISFFLGPSF